MRVTVGGAVSTRVINRFVVEPEAISMRLFEFGTTP